MLPAISTSFLYMFVNKIAWDRFLKKVNVACHIWIGFSCAHNLSPFGGMLLRGPRAVNGIKPGGSGQSIVQALQIVGLEPNMIEMFGTVHSFTNKSLHPNRRLRMLMATSYFVYDMRMLPVVCRA